MLTKLNENGSASESGSDSAWMLPHGSIELTDMIIGEGRRSQVRIATWLQQEVAVKQLVGWHDTVNSVRRLEHLHQSLNLMSSLRHPNLVAFLGACVSTANPPWLVFELHPQNLHDIIRINKRDDSVMGMEQMARVGLDMARAIFYMHSCGLVHGSLASTKVMMTQSRQAKLLYTPSDASAEEVNENDESDSDVYSIGVIMIEMATGAAPDHAEVEDCVNDVKWPRLREIIKRCVDLPEARPTADELCQQLLRVSR